MGRSRREETVTTPAGAAALNAIRNDHFPQLQKALLDFPVLDTSQQVNETEANKILRSDMDKIICTAARKPQPEMFDWLINERFPDWIPYYSSGCHSLSAILKGGPAIYEIFHEKWPELIDEDIGCGNMLGWSMWMDKNKAMVECLLRMGADPNDAHIGHHYLLFMGDPGHWSRRVPDDIIQLAIKYGLEVPEGAKRKHVSRKSCVVL